MIFPVLVEETVQKSSPKFVPLRTQSLFVPLQFTRYTSPWSKFRHRRYRLRWGMGFLLGSVIGQGIGLTTAWAHDGEVIPADLAPSPGVVVADTVADSTVQMELSLGAFEPPPSDSLTLLQLPKAAETLAFDAIETISIARVEAMLLEPPDQFVEENLGVSRRLPAPPLSEAIAAEHQAIDLLPPATSPSVVEFGDQTGLSASKLSASGQSAALASTVILETPLRLADNAVDEVEIDPALIEQSPTLQRWLQGTPNVLEDIRNDPSFRTRVRVGYSNFPSSGSVGGYQIGVEDVFLGNSGFTLSGDYGQSGNGDRESYGVDARYYVLPLGGYFNVAPLLGYRHVETAGYSTGGINVGFRLQAVLSRTGAADVSLTQSWVSLFGEDEVGITSIGAGYALTRNLRVSTEIQWQNSRQRKDSRVGVFLEWMFF